MPTSRQSKVLFVYATCRYAEAVSGIARNHKSRNQTIPYQDEAFIFIGKTGTTAKILHCEGNGLTLYVRKLSSGRFQIPKLNRDKRTCTLDYREFVNLILGEKWEIENTYSLKNIASSKYSGVYTKQ